MKIVEEIVKTTYADNGYYLPPSEAQPLIRCKDCKYFEIKDWWGDFNGTPILATSDCPTCNKWGDGCMTKPEGYCFLAEHK